MVSVEEEVLCRLLVIRRMVKENDFGSCVALIRRIVFNLEQFSNIPLKNEIKEGILAMKSMIDLGNKNVASLDKIAESLIEIFTRYGIE